MSSYYLTRPVPLITPLTRPFWDGCAEGRFKLQRCVGCARYRFFPTESCPDCRSTDYVWSEVSGLGTVFSWIVVHRSVDPAWQARIPFVTGVVELAEQPGCLVPGLIEGVSPADVRAGMPVRIGFERIDSDTVLPHWLAA